MRIIILGCFSKMALAVINDLAVDGHEIIGGAGTGDAIPLIRPDSWFKTPHLKEIFRYMRPDEDPESFKKDIIRACRKYRPRLIIPIGQIVSVSISRYKNDIERESGTVVPIANYETLSLFSDKWQTFKLATELRIPTPRTALLNATSLEEIRDFHYPVVTKPRFLTGALGIEIFPTWDRFARRHENLIANHPDPNGKEPAFICQEYVEGSLHDTGLIAKDGKTGPIVNLERIATIYDFGGSPTVLRTTFEPAMSSLAERIVEHVRWDGPMLLDFIKRSENDYLLLECNPRFWGSTRAAIEAGLPLGRQLIELFVNGAAAERMDSYQRNYVFKFLFPDCLYSWILEPRTPASIYRRIRRVLGDHGASSTGHSLQWGDLRHLMGFVMHGLEH
jgi:predicted ATP-grasp superfamily ATP-dependent carboligase